MSLRDRLRIYERPAPEARPTATEGPLHSMGGRRVETDPGPLWRFDFSYPVDGPRERALRSTLPAFLEIGGFKRLELEEMLFFDLETTGLSGGTGTYAFLVGIGYFREGAFRVEQYFLDEYEREASMLLHLSGLFRSAGALVAYNGRSFDLPLIKSRYRLNRVRGFPVEVPIVDLLYPGRRLFRGLYGSCTLKSMEEGVLGFTRNEDIPGWEIPDVFFAYQRHGETSRLPRVIEHNRADIHSMFLLVEAMGRIFHALHEKDYASLDPRLLSGLAHHLYATDPERFLDVTSLIHKELRTDRLLFKKYCTALKRAGRVADALGFWLSDPSIYSFEELAKHAEHREHDLDTALGHARAGLRLVRRGLFSENGEALPPGRASFHELRFDRRVERLEAKAARNSVAMRDRAGRSRP
ncbi:MAG TPA: ribonuclease H-like domain-containing protein [Spirochaetota bacterium]|nr:ribonuclease H-like domain-containing protein [Spirochaetota bacterium]